MQEYLKETQNGYKDTHNTTELQIRNNYKEMQNDYKETQNYNKTYKMTTGNQNS